MPAFPLSDADMTAIVAFIHDDKSQGGRGWTAAAGRWTPPIFRPADAEAGKRYFNGAGGCAACHSLTGDFATIGARYQGLALLHRMLYPGSGRDAGAAPAPPPTSPSRPPTAATVTGTLAHRDEFTIALTDADGWNRSWPLDRVTVSGDDPLRAHAEQLSKYTDEDIHDLVAYLQTLR